MKMTNVIKDWTTAWQLRFVLKLFLIKQWFLFVLWILSPEVEFKSEWVRILSFAQSVFSSL